MAYTELLTARIQSYLNGVANGHIIDPKLPFLELDWSQDHTSYFATLVKHKIITAKDVARETNAAQRAEVLRAGLGEIPNCVRDYARIYSRKIGVRVSYKGAITIPGQQCPTIIDYARGARLTAEEHGVPFAREAINDAIEEHYVVERDKALDEVRAMIEPRETFDWLALATGCFDLQMMSADFVAAVLRKTVWQVKRKLWGLPVTHHLMPVLFGSQGSGKSWFLDRLTGPVAALTTFSDFQAICDDRNIDLWRSFLIVLDEMAKADKSDIEVTKHVITAEKLERRPMRTNMSVTITQCASFLGASNMSLAELIRDETGNRRFVELPWVGAEIGFVDGFDFTAAWRSVHHDDADPMLPYMAELKAVQAGSRNYGPVESWLKNLDDRAWSHLFDSANNDGFITTAALFEHYLRYREGVNGGSEREYRSLTSFGHELSRVTGQTDYGLTKRRTAKGNGYHLASPDSGTQQAELGARK
jgi:hypothetical protein